MRINIGEEEQPEIGLIALIDCIFFLLMFFMVATSFKQTTEQQKIKTLPLVLPTASASFDRTNASAEPMVIGVSEAGEIYMDGSKITTQALRDRLRTEASKNPGRSVRIDGDQSTSYKNIIHVLDLCQFEKLNNISLHTRN